MLAVSSWLLAEPHVLQPSERTQAQVLEAWRTQAPTLPVMRLEMMSGRMSIFSILMRISPGKDTMVRAAMSLTLM